MQRTASRSLEYSLTVVFLQFTAHISDTQKLVKAEMKSVVPFLTPYAVHSYQASFAGPRKRKQPSMNSLVATAGKDFLLHVCHHKHENCLMQKK